MIRDIRDREIRIYTDAGRICRPLLIVYNISMCCCRCPWFETFGTERSGFTPTLIAYFIDACCCYRCPWFETFGTERSGYTLMLAESVVPFWSYTILACVVVGVHDSRHSGQRDQDIHRRWQNLPSLADRREPETAAQTEPHQTAQAERVQQL